MNKKSIGAWNKTKIDFKEKKNKCVVNTFFKDENVSHMLMEDMSMFVNRDFYL